MNRVKPRLTGALIALLAVLVTAGAAWAQDDRPKSVDKVYRDYEDDGVIEACDHTPRALQRTLDRLPAEADVETPDLRPALEAAIEQVEQDECEEEPEETATPDPTTTPPPAATPPPAPAPPAPAPDSGGDDEELGSVAPLPGGGGGDGGDAAPPDAGDVSPLPEATPVPEATPAPAPVEEPSGLPPEPVYLNDDDAVPLALLVLAGVLGVVGLLALLYAVLSRLGWGERRLAGVRRAGREAAFRAGGTWGDFADWIRVGR